MRGCQSAINPAFPNGLNGWYITVPTMTFHWKVQDSLPDEGEGYNEALTSVTCSDPLGFEVTGGTFAGNFGADLNANAETLDTFLGIVQVPVSPFGPTSPFGQPSCQASFTRTLLDCVFGVCEVAGTPVTQAPVTVAVDPPAGLRIDVWHPTISAAATSSPNTNGWYNHNVTVQFTCSDRGSGIATGACPADQVLSSEGTGLSSTTETVEDRAGLVSLSSNVVPVNIDKTPPMVTLTGVTDGAAYPAGTVLNPDCSTSDLLSGPATDAGVSVSGGPVGLVTATCSGATDKAGNAAPSVSASYWLDTDISGYLGKGGAYNFTNATLNNSFLDKLDLTGATAKNANFAGASMIDTILAGANLTQAKLTGADLTGAKLTGANLNSANLTDATVTGADFTNADLTTANLTGATGLTAANLTGVTWKKTICPDGTNSSSDGGSCINNVTP